MNHVRRVRTLSLSLLVSVMLFACSSASQAQGEEAISEVVNPAIPTVQEEPEVTVEPATVNLAGGEELVIVAGMLANTSGWKAGLAVEGEEITSPGPTIRVHKGETVTITFQNAHKLEDGRSFEAPHNFYIVADKDMNFMAMEPLWGAHVGGFGDPNLSEGERGSVTFTAEDAGSFFYVCAFLDHVEHGMWGHFIVEE